MEASPAADRLLKSIRSRGKKQKEAGRDGDGGWAFVEVLCLGMLLIVFFTVCLLIRDFVVIKTQQMMLQQMVTEDFVSSFSEGMKDARDVDEQEEP